MKKYLLLSVFCCLCAACVSTKPEAQHVRFTNNPLAVQGCEPRGNVRSSTMWYGGPLQGMGKANTETALRNKAIERGGNVVLQTQDTHMTTAGEVYRCETAQ